jgi:hypothetical protein
MDHSHTPAERRDDLAEDRDAAAADRDTTAQERDADGRRRDADAAQRDIRAGQQGHGLKDGFEQLRRQILDHFAQIENTTIDPADWPDISPAALDGLRARAAEQRRLAAQDRATAIRLLANLSDQISQLQVDWHAPDEDRRAAARDRQASAHDRRSSAEDRDSHARDRNQAAIEREQIDPPDTAEPNQAAARGEDSLTDRARQAVYESRQRIADARAYLTHHTKAPRRPTTGSDHDSARD